MSSTIFDKIVADEMKSWKIWEDEKYLAFLTPYPNTPGHTVVIKKENPGDYVFAIDDESYQGIMEATRTVAKILEKAFDTDRVGMLFHGLGVPHLHAQLIPFHANLDIDYDVAAKFRKENPQFVDEMTAADGEKMEDEKLDEIQKKILEVQK